MSKHDFESIEINGPFRQAGGDYVSRRWLVVRNGVPVAVKRTTQQHDERGIRVGSLTDAEHVFCCAQPGSGRARRTP